MLLSPRSVPPAVCNSLFNLIVTNSTKHLDHYQAEAVFHNRCFRDGLSPLSFAIRHNSFNWVHPLISTGMDVNQYSPAGITALHLAALYNRADMTDVLLSAGADPNQYSSGDVTSFHFTALHQASRKGHLQVVEKLIRAGADPDLPMTIDGETALHLAASYGHEDVIRYLVQHGADANIKSRNGNTPLHFAVKRFTGDYGIVDALIQEGASPKIRNAKGRRPVDLTKSSALATLLKLPARLYRR
jgi:ankyrin repeat protein